jgi:ABC-type multidrug transport system ATPase subunit
LNDVAIKARGVRKTYGKSVALKNLDLDVKSGVVYGFLGPNGAGKTTLIKILLGLSIPDAGEVEIFGKDLFLERNSILKSIGAVVESPSFFDYMTIIEKGEKICESRVSELVDKQERIQIKTPDSERISVFLRENDIEVYDEKIHGASSVFLVKGSEEFIPELNRRLVASGINIMKIGKHNYTLEEIFVEFTGKNRTDSASDGDRNFCRRFFRR